MEIHTIGFTKRSAADFFTTLKTHHIGRLVDVRLNNVSQLAGFAKRDDLRFFLAEIVGADYVHEPLLAPTSEMLDAYRKKAISWDEYERRFLTLMDERTIESTIEWDRLIDRPSVLLCSEATPEHCHRRLVLEYLAAHGRPCEVVDL